MDLCQPLKVTFVLPAQWLESPVAPGSNSRLPRGAESLVVGPLWSALHGRAPSLGGHLDALPWWERSLMFPV